MRSNLQLPGAHRAVKSTAAGGKTIYWYRHRGGPLLMRLTGSSLEEALAKEQAGQQALIAAYAASRPFSAAADVKDVRDLMRAYRRSPTGFVRLSPSTARQWGRWLDKIDQDFGDIQLRHMEDRQATSALIQWRDEMASHPRKADYGIQVFRRLLSFGCRQGLLERNAATGIETIYRSNRADVIVEPEELAAILNEATPQAALAIKLAAETGMRRGDLVDLRWADVRDDRIHRVTNKSRGRTTLLCPLSDDALEVIKTLRSEREARLQRGEPVSDHVLVTARGCEWKPNSLTEAFARAASKVGIKKRLHDLRGTAITRLKIMGCTHEEIALFVGWEVTQVKKIIDRYVAPDQVASDAIDRLEARRAMV